MSEQPIQELSRLLEGVQVCFCTLCSHQAAYGHCYACKCGNHTSAPPLAVLSKVLAANEHLKRLFPMVGAEVVRLKGELEQRDADDKLCTDHVNEILEKYDADVVRLTGEVADLTVRCEHLEAALAGG